MKARHKDTGEIIELAEQGIISHDGRRFCWYQVELIPEPIDDVKPSLPSNLDEAAEEIAKSEIPVEAGEALDLNGDCYETDDINWPERCGFIRGFKAGAEWMAGQGVILNLSIDELSCGAYNACVEQGLTSEDDVIFQIRKKTVTRRKPKRERRCLQVKI